MPRFLKNVEFTLKVNLLLNYKYNLPYITPTVGITVTYLIYPAFGPICLSSCFDASVRNAG
jgi:hypothetical protein